MSGSPFPRHFLRYALLLILSVGAALTVAVIYVDIFFAILLFAAFFLHFNLQIALQRSFWGITFIPSLALLGIGLSLSLSATCPTSWLNIGLAAYTILLIGLFGLLVKSLYWRIRLGSAHASHDLYHFFYSEIDYNYWKMMLAAWAKDNNKRYIRAFIVAFLSNCYIHKEQHTKFAPLLPIILPYWRKPYFSLLQQDAENPEYYAENYAFNIISNFDTLQIYCRHAQANPDFVPELHYICQLANSNLTDFISNPSDDNYMISYFKSLKSDDIDDLLQNKISQFDALTDIKSSLQQIFGLYYTALGISKNMPE